jgi:2,5-dihydroxypyridine 5,6-dioxygenase
MELCKVKRGEIAALVTQAGTRSEYIEASWAALRALGAKVFQLVTPSASGTNELPVINKGVGRSSALEGLAAAVEALKKTDIVIDLTTEGLIHVPERAEILGAGARMLTITEPPEILRRMMPREDLRRRVERAAEILEGAKQMRVVSRAGTDLRIDVSGAVVVMQYGYTDQPGRWDHWPGGFIAAYPVKDSAEGTLVLNVGDFIFPLKEYIKSPVRFKIHQGFIEDIEGDGLDAHLIRRYIESWHDPGGYGVSHVGWGLDETAQWSAMLLYDKNEIVGQDMRALYGNFMFSNGPNRYVGRVTPCHCDMPMLDCSIFLDERPIVIDGEIVDDRQRPNQAV